MSLADKRVLHILHTMHLYVHVKEYWDIIEWTPKLYRFHTKVTFSRCLEESPRVSIREYNSTKNIGYIGNIRWRRHFGFLQSSLKGIRTWLQNWLELVSMERPAWGQRPPAVQLLEQLAWTCLNPATYSNIYIYVAALTRYHECHISRRTDIFFKNTIPVFQMIFVSH